MKTERMNDALEELADAKYFQIARSMMLIEKAPIEAEKVSKDKKLSKEKRKEEAERYRKDVIELKRAIKSLKEDIRIIEQLIK
jgi:hypothetical protein